MSRTPESAQPSLESLARAQTVQGDDTGRAWQLVVRGIGYHLLDATDLGQLVEHLRDGRDFIADELGFEFLEGTLRVSLLDEAATCSPQALLGELEDLRRKSQPAGLANAP